jgi:8-oxo-dGTP pyrophosphatase MutT (NUDIX family)
MTKHLAATVYIVAKINNKPKILLHQHKKLHIWLGIGGHVEQNENPYEAAIREVKEETGLEINITNTKKCPVFSSGVTEIILPFMTLEEYIPRYQNKPAHMHIDFIYFGIAKNPKVAMAEKFNWFSSEEIQQLDLQDEVKYITTQAFKNCLNHL